jgi:UDP-N-acetylglucosamine:LPS N-acetylglucosamine transferase
MNAATVLHQSETTPESMAAAVVAWLEDPTKRSEANQNLREWDVPDAAEQIWNLIQGAAK